MKRYGFLAGCIILACGIMWSNITTAKCLPPKECKDPYVIAKEAFAPQPACIEIFDCRERGCDACVIRIIWRADIKSKDPQCDEHPFPDGSRLEMDLTYHMRQKGPCGTPVGRHKGRFKILSGTKLIGSGSMMGTNGLETHTPTGECCAWPHDEGCMDGKIKIKDPQTGKVVTCELTATYASELDPTGTNPNDPCDPLNWKFLTLKIDGVALCKWSTTTGLPDLVPVPDPRPGFGFCKLDDLGRLIVTVKNQGTVAAPASTTKVEFFPGGAFFLPTPAIPAGGSLDLAPLVMPGVCPDPDCNFTITVDSSNVVSESNEGNNSGSGSCLG